MNTDAMKAQCQSHTSIEVLQCTHRLNTTLILPWQEMIQNLSPPSCEWRITVSQKQAGLIRPAANGRTCLQLATLATTGSSGYHGASHMATNTVACLLVVMQAKLLAAEDVVDVALTHHNITPTTSVTTTALNISFMIPTPSAPSASSTRNYCWTCGTTISMRYNSANVSGHVATRGRGIATKTPKVTRWTAPSTSAMDHTSEPGGR
jgi:hypothetical protein